MTSNTNSNRDVWLWVAGVLLAVIGTLSSVAYASVVTRVTDLEQDRKTAVQSLADVKTQLALLQQKLEQVDSKQNEALTALANLQDSYRLSTLRNSNDSQRWNRTMDSWPLPPKKK